MAQNDHTMKFEWCRHWRKLNRYNQKPRGCRRRTTHQAVARKDQNTYSDFQSTVTRALLSRFQLFSSKISKISIIKYPKEGLYFIIPYGVQNMVPLPPESPSQDTYQAFFSTDPRLTEKKRFFIGVSRDGFWWFGHNSSSIPLVLHRSSYYMVQHHQYWY